MMPADAAAATPLPSRHAATLMSFYTPRHAFGRYARQEVPCHDGCRQQRHAPQAARKVRVMGT